MKNWHLDNEYKDKLCESWKQIIHLKFTRFDRTNDGNVLIFNCLVHPELEDFIKNFKMTYEKRNSIVFKSRLSIGVTFSVKNYINIISPFLIADVTIEIKAVWIPHNMTREGYFTVGIDVIEMKNVKLLAIPDIRDRRKELMKLDMCGSHLNGIQNTYFANLKLHEMMLNGEIDLI